VKTIYTAFHKIGPFFFHNLNFTFKCVAPAAQGCYPGPHAELSPAAIVQQQNPDQHFELVF